MERFLYLSVQTTGLRLKENCLFLYDTWGVVALDALGKGLCKLEL